MNVMKKIFAFVLVVCMIFMDTICFADEKVGDGSWAFYVYLIDDERSMEYNNSIIREMGSVRFGNNIKVVSETSWGQSFDTFLKYCNDNAKADHKVLIIAGEGEGCYGIRRDNYSYITFDDIRFGLERCYEKNVNDPSIDLTIFDASLMGCAEMGKLFDGYSKYLVASETLCYNGRGVYKKWFGDFVKNTNITADELGKNFIDSYMEMIDREVKDNDRLVSTNMSLYDVAALDKVYEGYNIFVKNIIKRIKRDNLLLSYISTIAKKTVTAGDSGDIDFSFNMVDLADFMYNLKNAFPGDTINMLRYIKDAVKYKKDMGFVKNTCGVSIYFPRVGFAGHEALLKEYTENIAGRNYVSAFYNYKMTGKLDIESKDLITKELHINIKDINYRPLDEIKTIHPTFDNKLMFTFYLNNTMKELKQDASILIYKRENDKFILYNEDSYMNFDGANNLSVKYFGKWDSLNDIPLSINMLSKTKDYKKYFTKVLHNNKDSRLLVAYESVGKTKTIGGIIEDYLPSRIVGNVVTTLKAGEQMSLYSSVIDLNTSLSNTEINSTFRYNSNYKVENKILPDGEYTMVVILEDIRGVRYMSENILFNIRNAAINDVVNEKEFLSKT